MNGIRLVSGYIDLMVVSVINFPLIYWISIQRNLTSIMLTTLSFVICILCKDALGFNIGKRLFKVKILKQGSLEDATMKQKIIRNIPLVIWPIEAIILLSSKDGQRLGDKLAHTETAIGFFK